MSRDEDSASRLRFVGPRGWEPLVGAVFAQLDHEVGAFAGRLLRELHDRGLGIPPTLAGQLAVHLSPEGRSGTVFSVWSVIDRRIREAWQVEEQGARLRLGFQPAACPSYYLERVVMPLLARVCHLETWLFAESDLPIPEDFATLYRRYEEGLYHGLRALPLPELFCRDRAATVEFLSRRGASAAALPASDPAGLAYLHRLDPRHEAPRARSRAHRPRSPSSWRPPLHNNEGGVDGIRLSHRAEDLSSMLASEHLYPPLLRLERLLHSGYFVLRRPPRRDTRRDTLVVAFLPWLDETSPLATALARASWFHAMSRLTLHWLRLGKSRSELIWVEADRQGRWREQRFRSCDFPPDLPLPEEPNALFRRDFLAALDWLPAFLDRHAAGRPLPDFRAVDEPASPEALHRWVGTVARQLEDDPRWRSGDERIMAGGRRTGGRRTGGRRTGGRRGRRHDGRHRETLESRSRRPLDFDAFANRQLMVLAPARHRAGGEGAYAGKLRTALGLPPGGPELSIVWLPERLTETTSPAGWAFTTGGRTVSPLLEPVDEGSGDPAADPDWEHRLAGVLGELWVETVIAGDKQ